MESTNMVVMPREAWEQMQHNQERILQLLQELKCGMPVPVVPGYIPAKDFMNAVGIGRTLFDELVKENKIKTIKKRRKIYVAEGEVKRYFTDPNI